MENENAEQIQPGQVTPAPETPVTQTETAPVESAPKAETPSNSQDEAVKKQNAAFAQMRRAKREAERKAAQATPATTPPVVTPPVVEQPKPEPVTIAPAPVQTNTEGIEVESEKAIVELAADKDLAKISGGVYEVVALVDSDPRLMRLHGIDPKLAFREAKEMYLAKAGITAPPPVPKPNTPSGGIGAGAQNLNALYAETEKHTVGTRDWHKAVDRFNAEVKRLNG